MQPSQQRSIFSGTIGQYSQQPATVPGVRISVNELRPTTRFNDLHEELQKIIENVDNFILSQIHIQEQCEGASGAIEKTCQEIPPDVEYCLKSLDNVQQALESDAESIAFAKDLVKIDATDAKLSFKVIQNLKLPQQYHHTNLWTTASAASTGPSISDAGDVFEGGNRNLVEYFSKQVDGMASTLDMYKRNIADVETYLKRIEMSMLQQIQRTSFNRGRQGERSADDQIRELAAVLREFEGGILGVAKSVGGVREQVQEAALGPILSHPPTRGSRFGTLQ